jgi:hypothetical protein
VNGTNFLVTALSGTSTVALTRTGVALSSRFAAAGYLSVALSANTYDPESTSVDIPLNTRVFGGTAGEFEVPAQAFSTKKMAVTIKDTLTVLKSAVLTSSQIYTFPDNVTSTEFYTNAGDRAATYLVANTAYYAKMFLSGGTGSGKLPDISGANVGAAISNSDTPVGKAVTSDNNFVRVTFTPSAAASAPVCTQVSMTHANGAAGVINGTVGSPLWTGTMYAAPTFTTVTRSTTSIESGVSTDVTVNFSGGTLGLPVLAGNVYLKIDTTYFVAKTLTGTTSGTIVASVLWVAEATKTVSVVVRYPSTTGFVDTDVPTVGTVAGDTINVTASQFPLYVLVPSTIFQGTTTIRLAPVTALRAL